MHFRAVLFHNFRRGLTQQQCMDVASSSSKVYTWFDEFNRGQFEHFL